MLLSIALVFSVGILSKLVFEKLQLPGLLGLILTGVILGPGFLNTLSLEFINLSDTLREIALIVIIFRAGLNLDIQKLLQNKISVILLSFVPATFEILAYTFLAPLLLNISMIDAAILGCIIGAVSPAVIVPNMIKIMNKGYGNDKGVGQMIMSAASVDDIYVITIFLSLLNVKAQGTSLNASVLINVLLTITLGILLGVLVAKLYNRFFRMKHIKKEYFFLIILSLLFFIHSVETGLKSYVTISSLLSIMAFGVLCKDRDKLLRPFESMWDIFEIFLFVLIGSQLNLNVLTTLSLAPFILLFLSLFIRLVGVFLALIKSSLNAKEKLFVGMSFIPKATVQAAIGPIPLALGFVSGEIILMVAILAILITAPLGDFLIKRSYPILLSSPDH